jgi:8-amino-7-oxononanoate synthase
MFTLHQSPGRTAVVEGKDLLFFSGYSYLGMSHVQAFVDLVKEGIDRFGILHPSSRISNTQLDVYEKTEKLLSSLTRQHETVLYSSGFLAGRAVIETLIDDNTNCYVVPGTHPAIQTSTSVLSNNWQEHFIQLVEQSTSDSFTLLCDSVNPLTATITDFSFLTTISASKKITCIIDDSHGIGLLGENGEGITSTLPALSNVEYIISYSLSKAFHINGGAISCSSEVANVLRQSPYYTASTSVAPLLCYAFINGQNLYNTQRKKLLQNVTWLREQLKDNKEISSHPLLPIFVLPEKHNQDYFSMKNMIISSFPYPNPSGQTINRIVLNALHTQQDLEMAASLINKRL